jgi:alpha-tubulin suppressor-like RCC1 family protein
MQNWLMFNHVSFPTDHGVVYGCGDNKFGQCGVGNQNPTILTATAVSKLGF